MRILICGSNYSPELLGTGKYTAEMARFLAARGHEVKVITAPPHYPDWRVRDGYSAWRWSRRVEDRVVVWRCPTWIPSVPRGVLRLLHVVSFALGTLPILLGQILWRPDIVWVVEPPLACAPTAVVVARLAGAISWLHVQDFEVDAAFELGLLRGRWARFAALGLERWLLRRFGMVSTISVTMMDRLRSKGVHQERIAFVPNWADDGMFDLVTPDAVAAMRRRLGIPKEAKVALYSGTMGRKQGLEILAKVAANPVVGSTSRGGLCFVFCGNGVGRPDLEEACRGLSNVRFSDLLPAEEFPSLLVLADIHLLPQLAEASDLVMPSKLTGMLASGRPVVAAAVPGSELAIVAAKAGIVIEPGNDQAMAAAVAQLAADESLRTGLGQAGRDYADLHLDRNQILSQIEGCLLRLYQRDTNGIR